MPEIIQRYQAGDSMEVLAAAFETSANSICRRFQKLGIQARPQKRYRKPHCAKCTKPTKGYSPLCEWHWMIRRGEIAYKAYLKKRKAKAA